VRHDEHVPSHVALLRGINVGGRNRIAMPALRDAVEALGHTDVSTYIASGNVLFTPRRKAASTRLAGQLEEAIDEAFGIRPRVAVLARDDLARTVQRNPYADESNPKYVHAVVFGDPPGSQMRAFVAAALEAARTKGSPDEATFVDDVLYLHTPAGLGRSELAVQLGRAGGPLSSKGSGTARNWSTVTKLLELCGD
jgi:uncharacterized protein (DUF1697 family)